MPNTANVITKALCTQLRAMSVALEFLLSHAMILTQRSKGDLHLPLIMNYSGHQVIHTTFQITGLLL